MTTLEEIQVSKKIWTKCQKFFENAYIERKWCINDNGQTNKAISKITNVALNMYLAAVDVKVAQENKEHNKHSNRLQTRMQHY